MNALNLNSEGFRRVTVNQDSVHGDGSMEQLEAVAAEFALLQSQAVTLGDELGFSEPKYFMNLSSSHVIAFSSNEKVSEKCEWLGLDSDSDHSVREVIHELKLYGEDRKNE